MGSFAVLLFGVGFTAISEGEQTMRLVDGSKITETEGEVLHLLGKAWNAFLELPVVHSDDETDFRHAIHAAQTIILARAAYSEVHFSPTVEQVAKCR